MKNRIKFDPADYPKVCRKKAKIVLKTRLSDGIYSSHGGGRTVIHSAWKAGPRNLTEAVKKLSTHIRQMDFAYGSGGCGRSWLEIAGVVVYDQEHFELASTFDMECWLADKPFPRRKRPPTLTQKAKQFIDDLFSGKIAAERRRDVERREEMEELETQERLAT